MQKQKIVPNGAMMLIKQLESTETETAAGLLIHQSISLATGEVVEVSKEYEHLFSPKDIVLFTRSAGLNQTYNKENCLWINCKGVTDGGDVYCSIKNLENEI